MKRRDKETLRELILAIAIIAVTMFIMTGSQRCSIEDTIDNKCIPHHRDK